ncbi:MAG TPA: bifunctional glycosyltransferase family 2 protein/CDP-glycerol:glycerophosphate glycerophosphotransferase [Streptosporangiaceae bacterium]|nr:bifunctional glycosyltransferase family 2 protein/CDP-glycerol:glycerophosphate glycerophosphotransferase [Streptosporangiaceae bacterium]
MTTPRISVVVAFYNNADDLADCLDSIAAQSHPDLEVIMVDDGSTDHSAEIARAKAAADPRFTLIQPEHGGPGGARNRGVERARGEFLAFVDGDDLLPANAYELLLHALERSGSDFVSGAVWRVGPKGLNPSALHTLALKGRQTGTHVTRTPRLLYDVSVWNKLFRRSFWDSHQLSFPEHVVWEDLRLMTKAHVLAKAVDVIPDIVYYWRERAQGRLSITQSRTSIANLRDRMTALDDIDSFIAAHSTARLLRAHQRKALKNDLWLYVQDLHKVTEAYRAEFADLVNGYLDHVGRRVLRSLPATHKLAYYLVRVRALPQLAELAAWLVEQPVRQVPMVRHLGRLRADLPFRTDSPVPVPARVFRPHWRDLDPFMKVDDIGWTRDKNRQSDRLVVTGRANVPSVDIPRRRNTTKIVVLRPPGRRLPVVRPARSFLHPEATALSEQDRFNYDWSGFEFTVSPRRFRETGEWQCYMLVRGHGVWRPARVHSPALGPAERPRPRQIAPGLRFGARWAGLGLNVASWRLGATVTAVRWPAPGTAEIEVEIPNERADTGPADDSAVPAELVLVRSRGAASRSFPAVPGATPGRYRALVPLGELAGAADLVDRVAGLGWMASDDGMTWDAYLKRPGQPRVRVAWPDNLPETRHLSGGQEAVAGQSRYGDLVMAERTPRPVIDEHEWQPGGRLVLRGSFLGARPGVAYETVLRRIGAADSHVIGFAVADERFTIEANLDRMPFFGAAVPLRDGEWNLYVRPAGTGADALAELKYDHGRLDGAAGQRQAAGHKWYRLLVTGHDRPLITAEPQLRRVEQGNFGARALRRGFYPALLRGTPLRDQVLFVSWKGKSCGDNPLGIAEELRRRGDDREHLWAVTDWSVPVPGGGTAVLRGTQEYYEALARSKHIISNDDMQAPFRKRDGQTYLQTWHGTPLKKIGFDIANPQFISGTAYFDHLAKDIAQWDLLLSPNPFSTPVMRGAFRYEGEICEYGYPRNDLLSRSDAAEVAARVRDRLGLPDGKRVVLYAPTWRDNQVYANGRRYRFDMRLDLERAWSELGEDYVFLIRGHHHMADDVPAGMRPGFAINVTAYPDITELYLVSDALVTDYSSTMFDYAVTGRPMLFFTYDLADYRDNLRGFYFDFEAEPPGPLLATSDEVIAAVRDVDAVAASYRDAYERFAARFAPLDDGKAGARVCDRVFRA